MLCERVQELAFFVGQVRDQGVREQIDRPLQVVELGAARTPVTVGCDEPDQRSVNLLDDVGDHVMFVLESVEHLHELGVCAAKVPKDAPILECVVRRDHPAVRLAVRPERPVVLPHGHRVEGRPRLHAEVAQKHLIHHGSQLLQLGS